MHPISMQPNPEQLTTLDAAFDPKPGAPSLLPSQPSFAGHGTFALRSGWLKKGLDALQDDADAASQGRAPEVSIFNSPQALSVLGVGKNMVGAIRYWLLVTRLAREEGKGRIVPTELGRQLIMDGGYDPYLEDDATLWLLHWQLCGPRSLSFTWAYTFNVFRDWEFGRDALVEAVLNATHSLGKQPSRETIDRDVICLLQTYVSDQKSVLSEDNLDCPLRSLGLLRPSHHGHFRFLIEAKPSLPDEIFFYALFMFWSWKRPDARTLPVWEICHAEGSPGQVFKLDENSVLDYLDSLESATQGRLQFEDTAQTRQIVMSEGALLKPSEFLESYYRASQTSGHSL